MVCSSKSNSKPSSDTVFLFFGLSINNHVSTTVPDPSSQSETFSSVFVFLLDLNVLQIHFLFHIMEISVI